MDSRHLIKGFFFTLVAGWAITISAAELEIAAPEDVGISGERLNRVVEQLETFVADDKLAGAAIHVARHGKVVLHDAVKCFNGHTGTWAL